MDSAVPSPSSPQLNTSQRTTLLSFGELLPLSESLYSTESIKCIRYALSYPLLGMIFDIFDGKVARWRNESSMLGQELDSLADSVSVHLCLESVFQSI